jgi:PleD family two-component response regulator
LHHKFSNVADHVTISVGFALIRPSPDQTPIELMDITDKMLYQAKAQGRNRVCGMTATMQ